MFSRVPNFTGLKDMSLLGMLFQPLPLKGIYLVGFLMVQASKKWVCWEWGKGDPGTSKRVNPKAQSSPKAVLGFRV